MDREMVHILWFLGIWFFCGVVAYILDVVTDNLYGSKSAAFVGYLILAPIFLIGALDNVWIEIRPRKKEAAPKKYV